MSMTEKHGRKLGDSIKETAGLMGEMKGDKCGKRLEKKAAVNPMMERLEKEDE